jgi:hypothetical protein
VPEPDKQETDQEPEADPGVPVGPVADPKGHGGDADGQTDEDPLETLGPAALVDLDPRHEQE